MIDEDDALTVPFIVAEVAATFVPEPVLADGVLVCRLDWTWESVLPANTSVNDVPPRLVSVAASSVAPWSSSSASTTESTCPAAISELMYASAVMPLQVVVPL